MPEAGALRSPTIDSRKWISIKEHSKLTTLDITGRKVMKEAMGVKYSRRCNTIKTLSAHFACLYGIYLSIYGVNNKEPDYKYEKAMFKPSASFSLTTAMIMNQSVTLVVGWTGSSIFTNWNSWQSRI